MTSSSRPGVRTRAQHRARRPILVSALVTAIAGGCLVAAIPPVQAADPPTITVFPEQQYQQIEGWGTSLAWWANVVGGWDDAARNAVADALFDPVDGIGMNVVRYNIGGVTPSQTCSMANWYPGAIVESFQTADGVWDWTKDANQRWMLDAAQDRGAGSVQAFANSAPSWMTANGCSGGNSTSGNLQPANYQKYVDYLVRVVQHFQQSWGTTFDTVEPFNEPAQSWPGTRQEGMGMTTSAQNDIVKKLDTALAAAGSPTGVAANDDVTYDNAYNAYMAFDATARAAIDTFTTHAYGGSNRLGIDENIRIRDGKDVWMSEWGGPDRGSEIGAAMSLSRQVLADMQGFHPSAWVLWQSLSGGNPNLPTDNWGLLHGDITPTSDQTFTKPTRYYAMGNYSKFVRPGSVMIGDDNANTFSAYDTATDTVTIVRTNPTTAAVTNRIDLSGFTSTGATVERHRTSATEDLAHLSDLAVTGKSFVDTNPAQSITTYVVHGVTLNPANLLGNGGFETGGLAPWAAGPTSPPASVGATNPHEGTYAAQIVPTTTQNASIYQEVVAPVTRSYTFGADIANATSPVQIGIQVNGWQRASINAAAGQYHSVAASFQATAGQTIKIYMLSTGSASSTYVDDVILY